jgi:hypothetical protein
VTKRIRLEGVSNFAFAPGTLPPVVAAFVPEKKGGPGQASIYKYPAVDQPVASTSPPATSHHPIARDLAHSRLASRETSARTRTRSQNPVEGADRRVGVGSQCLGAPRRGQD